MRFFHLSDLHLGKRLYESPMMEDQAYILKQILGRIKREKPDGLILAGDLYDKPIPSSEAVRMLDDFLVAVAELNCKIFAISGNHDSSERLSFGERFLAKSGVYLSALYQGKITSIPLEDEYGTVWIHLLPFLKPAMVRPYFQDMEINTYTEAVAAALSTLELDPAQRHVLVAHQFVTGAIHSESEEVSVGGLDNVDASVFSGFDYVALGHLHTAQSCGRETIRYCGSPLAYSFPEGKDGKSLTVVELKEKGNISIQTEPILPKRDMVELMGTYEKMTMRSFYAGTHWQDDFVHITLTDEDDIPDAASKLHTIYHNLLRVDYDNTRTRQQREAVDFSDAEEKSPLELVKDFYKIQNGVPVKEEQEAYLKKVMEEIWEEDQ